ncbi:bacitracin ABC transporter ATP-binding protein [Listeria fleischmannii FSL S10-1203]|uniref:Bacitracin ABC transporter ATP-binding protein n=2 Tax=Listeria fleischmannii TaxID=1069827 RepID=W7DJ27_9LIST|nr:bacitracin ABC transporter ATP-binding protein [Listeria fleischmannii FSL S10-1203]
MSGWKNLKQFAKMNRKNISDDQIKQIVEKVKMTHAIHNKVKTYSLGMRQRLGVAQALIHQPALLILDEPTNGLDPQGMAEFRMLIKELATNGTSVLISSHLLAEIQQITDRFAIIDKGHLTHIEKMSDLTEEKILKVTLEVSDGESARLILDTLDLEIVEQNGNLFVLNVTREVLPEISRALVRANVDIFELSKIHFSLEDRFLALTNGGEL